MFCNSGHIVQLNKQLSLAGIYETEFKNIIINIGKMLCIIFVTKYILPRNI